MEKKEINSRNLRSVVLADMAYKSLQETPVVVLNDTTQEQMDYVFKVLRHEYDISSSGSSLTLVRGPNSYVPSHSKV